MTVNRIIAIGQYIGQQLLDLPEQRAIANNRSPIRIWVKIGTLESALLFLRVFEPCHNLAIFFDTFASANIVFGPVLRGQ